MIEDSVSIILPIYNREDIIERVLDGIHNNISDNVIELLLIFDGCTDNSEEKAWNIINKFKIPVGISHTPDLNEVLTNNFGLKMAYGKYCCLIQDDMIIKEPEFDKRLLKPFKVLNNVFAVSGRDGVDARIDENGNIKYYNLVGKDREGKRDIFGIRDIANRGPFMVDRLKAKELGFFDEEYAPITQDDSDICFRAYKKGWIVGSYVIDYDSDLSWSWTRRLPEKAYWREFYEQRNLKKLVDKYSDMILAPKHSEDYYLP